jgi:hypothetical protein
MAQSAPAGFGPSFLPGGTQAQVDPNALRDSKFGRPDFVPSNIPPKKIGGNTISPGGGTFNESAGGANFQFGGQPAGGFGGALSSVLGGLFGAFRGLDKNGPNAGPNNTPIESNPFNAGTNNPFLTGSLAPSTFDPFTNQGLLTGNGPGRGITTDRQNNLVGVPPPPASPFRGGVGTRQAGRGLLNRGGRRGRFQTR